MDHQRRSLRVGGMVLAAAVILRLAASGAAGRVLKGLTRPETVAVLMYLETGRVVRPYSTLTYPAESPPPERPEPTTVPRKEKPAIFTPEDLERIELYYDCDYRPDLEQLLLQPLEWDLKSREPAVLIIHTHGTESYTACPGEEYEPSGDYRTLDEARNMISVGDALAAQLEQAGISVVHDRSLHDYPSYNGSYMNARVSMEQYLADNPGVCLVLDLHRDAALAPYGQYDTSAQVDGQESAQLMIVVGTDAGGLEHPRWQENLALGLKLHGALERENPGICRSLNLRSERFNADENPGALLIEVGAAGNTRPEALVAVRALGEAIISLAAGANLPADSAR